MLWPIIISAVVFVIACIGWSMLHAAGQAEADKRGKFWRERR